MRYVEIKSLSQKQKQVAQRYNPKCLVCGTLMILVDDHQLAVDLSEMFRPEESKLKAVYICPSCASVIVAWSVGDDWYAVHYDFQTYTATDIATGNTWTVKHESKGRI